MLLELQWQTMLCATLAVARGLLQTTQVGGQSVSIVPLSDFKQNHCDAAHQQLPCTSS